MSQTQPLPEICALPRDARVYVAGHRGLVGSAITRRLRAQGYSRILTRTSAEVDLRDAAAVQRLFRDEQPEYVFLAAAKVGGILANQTYPADFIRDNLLIATHIIAASQSAGVRRLLFLGSSCIYPKLAPQPLKEEYLLTGALEPTNRPYALAKIAAIELCWSYNRQFGTQYLAAMPTNVYGPGDRYHPENSHVLPALIRKMHQAKVAGAATVSLWGSGAPRREFIFSDDLADACLFLMNLPDSRLARWLQDGETCPIVNIGSGEDLAIAELAEMVAEIIGFQGKLVCDATKPDGTPRKLLDLGRLRGLGWTRPCTGLRQGIGLAYADFLLRCAVAPPI